MPCKCLLTTKMRKLIPALFVALAVISCGRKTSGNKLPSYPKVDSLMKVMTLEEKIGQTVLFTSDWSVTGPSMRQGYLDDIRTRYLFTTNGFKDTVEED